MAKAILTLDIANTTGYAIRHDGNDMTSGVVEFKNSPYEGGGMPFYKFQLWLEEIKTSYQVELVFYEIVKQRHKSHHAARVYFGFLSTLTRWCEENRIPFEGVDVGTIKKHATGKGNAGKDLMIKAAKDRGHNPQDDNEADALALLYWSLENRDL